MTFAQFSDFLTPSFPLLDLIYTKNSRNLPYYVHFSMNPSPSDVDIIYGSSLKSAIFAVRASWDVLRKEVTETFDARLCLSCTHVHEVELAQSRSQPR